MVLVLKCMYGAYKAYALQATAGASEPPAPEGYHIDNLIFQPRRSHATS